MAVLGVGEHHVLGFPDALRAMATQTSGLIAMLGADAYAAQVCEEWFVDAPEPPRHGS